jgi:hypothetical protein
MLYLIFAKVYTVPVVGKLFSKNYLIFYQNYSCQAKYPGGYPALTGYPVSGFLIRLISGIRLFDYPDIRPAGYPAKTVSGASLIQKFSIR